MSHSHASSPAQAPTAEEVVTPELESELESLRAQVAQAEDQKNRALADYRNLVRFAQEERSKTVRLAARSLVSDLLQPLDHLSLAAKQLNDQGLNMVVAQFWQALNDNGLKEVNPLGLPFDAQSMEAIKKEDEGELVTAVLTKGYELNGELIQVAKVTVGSKVPDSK